MISDYRLSGQAMHNTTLVDLEDYWVICFCVMPSHMHLIGIGRGQSVTFDVYQHRR